MESKISMSIMTSNISEIMSSPFERSICLITRGKTISKISKINISIPIEHNIKFSINNPIRDQLVE